MSGLTDYYGFDLSTANTEAAAAFDLGARSFVAWRADAIGYLDAAIAADADFPLPKILKAWILHAGRTAKFDPMIKELLTAVTPALADSPWRVRALAEGLQVAYAGNLQAGAAVLEAYLAEEPLDLVAHRLLQFELFWSGESQWMRDVVERAAPAWEEASPDFGHFLAVRSFSNEESGDYATADATGREAIEREPKSAWGAHAIAHVLLMQGRAEEGIEWLEGLCGSWDEANQIKHHNWWHLCLFLLEKGEHERILHLLDTQVRNPESPLVQAVPDATIDIQNVASLLMRLELRGVDVGGRWQSIADICAGRIHDHANPFTSAHDAMVLSAAGKFEMVSQLADNMRAHGLATASAVSNANRVLGVPLVEAMTAHRKREYTRVVDLLWPVRRGIYQVGGSHAQRDIFFQVLVHATMQAGRRQQRAILLADIAGIGFEKVCARTLYKDAAAMAT